MARHQWLSVHRLFRDFFDECHAFTQSKFAFARGASRQWGVPWSVQMSPWWNGYETTFQTLQYGHSLSLYTRMLMHGWFAGAAWLTPENSADIVFNNGLPNYGINSWGVALNQLYAFINAHDCGIPYTPIAVVLDHYAGYNSYAHLAWGTLPFTTGDVEIDDLFVNQLFPNSDFIHYNPFPGDQELGYLRETPYGFNDPNALTLAYAGLPNYAYRVQVTTNITADFNLWMNLPGKPTSANASGIFTFTDTNAAASAKSYRIVSP